MTVLEEKGSHGLNWFRLKTMNLILISGLHVQTVESEYICFLIWWSDFNSVPRIALCTSPNICSLDDVINVLYISYREGDRQRRVTWREDHSPGKGQIREASSRTLGHLAGGESKLAGHSHEKKWESPRGQQH